MRIYFSITSTNFCIGEFSVVVVVVRSSPWGLNRMMDKLSESHGAMSADNGVGAQQTSTAGGRARTTSESSRASSSYAMGSTGAAGAAMVLPDYAARVSGEQQSFYDGVADKARNADQNEDFYDGQDGDDGEDEDNDDDDIPIIEINLRS